VKIAILSDFHLGYERFREDAYAQAEEALNGAAERADMIIIPGDIFDNRAPKPDVIAEAINLFRNLSNKKWGSRVTDFIGDGSFYTGVPIIAIPGTHERRAQEAADPVDILGLAGLVVDVSNATAIVEGNGERIAVRGMGGIADDRFREAVARENPVPTEGAFNIFMFHESLYELLPFNSEYMHVDELPKGFDLYVSGHIHNRVEAEVHGRRLLIPGSTVLTQLKTGEQEQKGFFIFDTKTSKYEFIKINSRRFVVLKMDLGAGSANPVDSIQNGIDAVIKSGSGVPVIRVIIEGKIPKTHNVDIEINDIPRRYAGSAIVEISKGGVSGESVREAVASDSVVFERMSVRDYGIGIFLEKIKAAGVSTGDVGPVELLDMLGSDASKDKVVARALDELIG
jgi:DNA repair exonuclease SbcCD nuclease subunit